MQLIRELGLNTYPTYGEGEHIAEIRTTRAQYTGRIPKLNPLVLADIGQTQYRLDRIARQVAAAEPWRAPQAEELDRQTFDTWLHRTARTPGGRDFFRLITEAVFSNEPEDMSALWATFYVARRMGSTSSSTSPAGPSRTASSAEHSASRSNWPRNSATGSSSTPPSPTSTGSPQPPPASASPRAAASPSAPSAPPSPSRRRSPPGSATPPACPATATSSSSGCRWAASSRSTSPTRSRSGDTPNLSGQANSTHRPFGTVLDNTPHDGSCGVLVGFLEGRHADTGSRMDPDERRAQVINDLVGYFGPKARNPIAFIERDWAQEEYSRGCYGAFAVPGALTRFGPALRRPVGPLHWG